LTLTLIEKLEKMRSEAVESKLQTNAELYKNRLMGEIEVYDYVLGELKRLHGWICYTCGKKLSEDYYVREKHACSKEKKN